MRDDVLRQIVAERERQDSIWGEQNHNLPFWNCILVEEIGEVARSTLAGNIQGVRQELIQCAAVAVAMIEYIDRQEAPDDRP